MSPIQRDVDQILSSVEKGFNIGGYVPGVSSFTGPLRFAYGKLEIIGGIAAAALYFLHEFSRNPHSFNGERTFKTAMGILVTYALHGVANIARSVIETVPFLSLVTCLPYDLSGRRFVYPYESVPHQNRTSVFTFRAT